MVDPKGAIEKQLVDEAVGDAEFGRSFGRIFNKEGDTFSRIFSRGGGDLPRINAEDLASMSDAAFKKFSDRLRSLQSVQENPLDAEKPPGSSKGR